MDRLQDWIDGVKDKLTEAQIAQVSDILEDYKKDNQVLKTSS